MQLRSTRLFEPTRDIYCFLFNRPAWKTRRDRSLFFSQFIKPGMLVFDIGAFDGEYTRHFLQLGAKVIAVEPNPAVHKLFAIHANGNLVIERVAIGDQEGTADLHLNPIGSLCSLSEKWMSVATTATRFNAHPWNGTISVPVKTLDSLITKYGMPDFLKVDVEGFEEEVFRGLSKLPPMFCFEVNAEFIEPAMSILQRCTGYECNYLQEQPRALELKRWISPQAMQSTLLTIQSKNTYCDIYARKRQ